MYTELRQALKAAKVDQYELANWLGVSASAVSNRMTGKSRSLRPLRRRDILAQEVKI